MARHDQCIFFVVEHDLVGVAVLGKPLDRPQIEEKQLSGDQRLVHLSEDTLQVAQRRDIVQRSAQAGDHLDLQFRLERPHIRTHEVDV
jgi:hypothetical protein